MDKELDKKYYRISEVCALLDLPASTLRFWESQFDLLKPKRTTKGTRLYTPTDVENVRIIKYLIKDKGLKIEAAQEQLRKNKENVSRRYQAIHRLETIKNQLTELLQSLTSRKN
ncbi:MAG: MerR family transcriptional regulator [Muribaculaceae bacterium]|nr:MerR family transcriptional regulator [Muribaculaceae bacterium]